MKAYVVFSIAFLFSLVAECQTEFGGIAGLNYNKFISSEPDKEFRDLGLRADFHIGAYLKHEFAKRFMITTGVSYEGKGGTSGDSKFKIEYLSIPVTIGYSITSWCNIELGPSFSYRLETKEKFLNGPYRTSLWQYMENDFDFGAIAGLSFSINKRIHPYVRYNRGFISVDDYDFRELQNSPNIPNIKQFNQTIQAGVAIMIKRVGKQSIGTSY